MVSTLMVFVTRYLAMDSLSLGYLLSTYGLLTMFSEGVIVRLAVPAWGEITCIRVGLVAYSLQALTIVFATSSEWIFASLFFSLLSNLVYPSVCSLVTKVVGSSRQGEALGALNGIKSLTEGLGPLLFGSFMTLFENSVLPSAPYVLISYMALWAYLQTYELPVNHMDEVVEKYGSMMSMNMMGGGGAGARKEKKIPEARGLLIGEDDDDDEDNDI
jgi:DHA1 family tetracycline resistance protein-like MFS transporter